MITHITLEPYFKVFKLALDIFLESTVRDFLLLFTVIELFLQLKKSLIGFDLEVEVRHFAVVEHACL